MSETTPPFRLDVTALDGTVADLVTSFRESGDPGAAAEVLFLAGRAKGVTGDHESARRLYEASLTEAPPQSSVLSPATERALLGLAEITSHAFREYDRAADLLAPLLTTDPQSDHQLGARLEMAYIHLQRGLTVTAEHDVRKVLTVEHVPGPLQARAHQYLGMVLGRLSDERALGEAVKSLSKAAELSASDAPLLSQIQDSLGRIHSRLGNYGGALRWFGDSLSTKRQLGDRPGMAMTHGGMAEAHLRAGDIAAARTNYERDLEIVCGESPVNHVLVSQLHCNLCDCARRGGSPIEAEEHLHAAAQAASRLESTQQQLCQAYITWHRGRLQANAGDPEIAIGLYREAESSFTSLSHPAPLPTLSRDLGAGLLRLMDLTAARRALEMAEKHESDPHEQQHLYHLLAELAQAEGHPAEARHYSSRARYLAERHGQLGESRARSDVSVPDRDCRIELVEVPPGTVAPGSQARLGISLLDGADAPLSGEAVVFESAALLRLGGRLDPDQLRTDAQGRATAVLHIGHRDGRVTVEAYVPSAGIRDEISFSVYTTPQS